MIRTALALMFLTVPAIAAPTGHRQPTSATLQQPGADPAQPSSTDSKAEGTPQEQARIKERNAFMKRQEASEAKMRRTLGGICNGCGARLRQVGARTPRQ